MVLFESTFTTFDGLLEVVLKKINK